ncbi:hypothetical protein SAMN05216522_10131 [Rosenbergiella nectarea]|uniref:Uncharacterized protein n=1 Tax=Rosenbergiella nectarea TaxID=988801 RepID=A0A1H9CVU7_9GAMM|nr:hypothetical protein [Rosenbergiella nectarea]SEQ05356.1 hypothetical protein SAMN05216522_10131 [Rosenbergiella nectarea]
MKRVEELKNRLEWLESAILEQEGSAGIYAKDGKVSKQLEELKVYVKTEIDRLSESEMTEEEQAHVLPALNDAWATDIHDMEPNEELLNKVYNTQSTVSYWISNYQQSDEGALL